MELAVATHHSSPMGGWPGATLDALRGQTKASSGGRRPGVLKEPEPPNVVERVLRHTVDQIVVAVPLVPLLDDPVPQTVDTVLDFFRALDLPVGEQVIAVPKISTDRVSQRLVERRLPQMVEQLVDVPTVLSPLRIAEQIFGIPAPQRGGNWSLQGPLPGQSSTLSPMPKRISERIAEQIAVSSPAERISKRTVEQIVDISPGDDRGQGSSSSAHGKKVRSAGQVSADLPRHVSSSTPAAQPVPDPWWELLTPALQAEIEEARAEVRREQLRKRKRKKRRKRRTPRTSSLPSRARRRQRQWSACYAGFTGHDTPRVLFPSVDARPKMLCIMAGMHQEDSYAVLAGDDAPRAVPSRFHRCSSWTIYWPVVGNDRFSGPGAVLGQVLTCPLLCLTGEVGPDSTKKPWNCRCCSSSTVADVAASCSDKLLQFSRREQQVCTVQTVHFPWRSPRCCSWTRLSCPLCATTGARVPDSSENLWRSRRCSTSSRSFTSPSWRRVCSPWL